jgi:hypothetical protein
VSEAFTENKITSVTVPRAVSNARRAFDDGVVITRQ